jgi:hypothetical protein
VADFELEGLTLIALNQLGVPPLTITAADIKREPRFANANAVWAHRLPPVGIEMSHAGPDGPAGGWTAEPRLPPPARPRRPGPAPAVMALAYSDLIELDLFSQPLGPIHHCQDPFMTRKSFAKLQRARIAARTESAADRGAGIPFLQFRSVPNRMAAGLPSSLAWDVRDEIDNDESPPSAKAAPKKASRSARCSIVAAAFRAAAIGEARQQLKGKTALALVVLVPGPS